MCTVLLPPGVNLNAVNKCIINHYYVFNMRRKTVILIWLSCLGNIFEIIPVACNSMDPFRITYTLKFWHSLRAIIGWHCPNVTVLVTDRQLLTVAARAVWLPQLPRLDDHCDDVCCLVPEALRCHNTEAHFPGYFISHGTSLNYAKTVIVIGH
jgi:hypothetical protein